MPTGPRAWASVPEHLGLLDQIFAPGYDNSRRFGYRYPGVSEMGGQTAAHCPGRPLQRQGRSLRSRRLLAQTQTLERWSHCRPGGRGGGGQARGPAPGTRAANLHSDRAC